MHEVRVNGIVLVSELTTARNVLQRTRGLMLSRTLRPGAGLDIRPCNSIHMMFMRFRIDAVFYDKHGIVLKVAPSVRTWIGLVFGGRKAAGVLELPVGAARFVSVGDQLAWSESGEEKA